MGNNNYKFKPKFRKTYNNWEINFPYGVLPNNQKRKTFKTEEDARSFVLNLMPDIYDEKIETDRCCIDCGYIFPIEGSYKRRMCRSCSNIKRSKIRKNRKTNGLCSYARCNNVYLPNGSVCYEHWFSNKASDHLNNKELYINLINIYEKQNRKCVYTGVDLIPSDNMHLDHIISRYDSPELINDINNLQWVHKDINLMKTRFSHKEFIMMCKFIAKRF